jgi:hypothetical protein
MAALCCYQQGETSRLIYRPRRHRKHKGKGRDSFSWRDYRDLVVRAHIQLGAPIVPIWDCENGGEDAYEKDSPRAGEADLIVAKHRYGHTAKLTVAHQAMYDRLVDMARY